MIELIPVVTERAWGQPKQPLRLHPITGFTGCNTCPNLAECHKSGYCVEQIAKQEETTITWT